MELGKVAHNDALVALHLGLVVVSLILCGLLALRHLSPSELTAAARATASLPQYEPATPPRGGGPSVTWSGTPQQRDFSGAPHGGGPGINWGGVRR
jgi:hypothetical protein